MKRWRTTAPTRNTGTLSNVEAAELDGKNIISWTPPPSGRRHER